jgi:hypothetical protein
MQMGWSRRLPTSREFYRFIFPTGTRTGVAGSRGTTWGRFLASHYYVKGDIGNMR